MTTFNGQFQAAVESYRSQQYAKAEAILGSLLKQLPSSFELNELMGMVCTAERQPGRASGYFSKAVQLKPASAEAHMYWAASLMDLRHNSRAEEEFRKAVQLEPGNYDTNHNLGEFYIAAGKISAAVPYLREAQQIEPSSENNGYDLALAEIKTGKYINARADLNKLLESQNAADLHSLLGLADEKTGAYVQAANEYELAARMSPTEQNIFAWGSELLVHDTLEPAVRVFQRGVQLYPSSGRLHVGLGIALYSRTHYEEAINAFCQAIDLNPHDPRPYEFLGKIYDVSPLQAHAVTERFARFAELQPRNPKALYYYALSLWKASRSEAQPASFGKVQQLLERSVSLDPSFAEAHLQLGIFYFQEHHYAQAVAQYRLAIQAQSDLADAHYRLGEALVRMGNRAEAQHEFQTFTRLHAVQVKDKEKARREIMQFVYTTAPPGKHTN